MEARDVRRVRAADRARGRGALRLFVPPGRGPEPARRDAPERPRGGSAATHGGGRQDRRVPRELEGLRRGAPVVGPEGAPEAGKAQRRPARLRVLRREARALRAPRGAGRVAAPGGGHRLSPGRRHGRRRGRRGAGARVARRLRPRLAASVEESHGRARRQVERVGGGHFDKPRGPRSAEVRAERHRGHRRRVDGHGTPARRPGGKRSRWGLRP